MSRFSSFLVTATSTVESTWVVFNPSKLHLVLFILLKIYMKGKYFLKGAKGAWQTLSLQQNNYLIGGNYFLKII